MTTAVAPSPLIFSWAPPRRRASALIVFLIASIILHAACFYVFQIVYPPTVALLPAPARVSLISPDDSESIAFLRWVEAEDPALATTTQRPPGSKTVDLPKLQHIPSYATHEPKLKSLPPTTPDLSIPSSAAIGPVRIPILSTAAIAPPVAHKTSVQFSESADAFGTPTVPGFTFQASRIDAPANARFRVAIDTGGAMRFCFLIESSGDPALDEQGRSFLQLCRFTPKENTPPSDEPILVWSVATILWGNDITPPTPNTPAASP
jgi:hypothetical protein